jgi:Trk K+ transport system NAD-binding subunit
MAFSVIKYEGYFLKRAAVYPNGYSGRPLLLNSRSAKFVELVADGEVILSQLGVHHIVRPEHDMGKRVAHLVAGRMMDYMEFDDGYAMVKTTPPAAILGQSLGRTEVRKRFGVTIVAIKRSGEDFTYATPETIVNQGEVIIASGKTYDVEHFSDQR